ncbi:VWA domain-containing protein [Candidatus Magnetominusculus xianensis]|uniref:VWA domain-containing protein n=2 Tax=Candidatus Magnetominusculus xianensis TaxID=1748249 RepID=A0ABR5SNB4_9BACT|nr:VWA domain-containing protein [Candidatus Magnetominusculus xianensis]
MSCYVFLALVLCCTAAFGQHQDNISQQQDALSPSIKISDVSMPYDGRVSLSAAVYDRMGNPIGGLKKDSFTLYIDDKRISDFSFKQTSDDPLSVIIAVDISGSMKGVPIVEAKKIIAQFMGYLKENDYAALFTFGIDVNKLIGFTKDKDIIYSKVDELRANENRTVLFKAVTECLKQASSSATPKTAILLITDSKDEHSSADEADVITAVKDAGIPVYTIALGKYKYLDFLKTISEVSGGQSYQFPKYEDVALLARASASGLKAMYQFQFPFSAPSGKYTAFVKAAINGADVTAKKEFSTAKDSKPPVDSSPAYPTDYSKVDTKGAAERPVSQTLFYLLIGLSAVSLILIVHMITKTRKPDTVDEHQSSELKKIHGEVAATADKLTKIDSEIKHASDKNSELTAALSTEIKTVGGQISTLSGQMDAAAASINNSITDTKQALTETAQTQHEQGLTGLKAELSAFKNESIDKNSDLTAALSTEIKAVGGQISTLSGHVDAAAASINNSITDTRQALTETAQTQHEQGLTGLKAELSTFKDEIIDKNSELTAALSTEIKAVGGQTSIVGRQMEDAASSIKNKITDTRLALTEVVQTRHEEGLAGLKALKEEMSDFKDATVEKNSELAAALSTEIKSVSGHISAVSKQIDDKNAELTASVSTAVSTIIRAVGGQISTVSKQIDDAVNAMTNSAVDLERILTDAIQSKYEKEFSALKVEIKAIEEALSVIMVKQIEYSERQPLALTESVGSAASETIYKDNIVAIETLNSRLSTIDSSIANLDTEVKKYANRESESDVALRTEITAVDEKLSDIPRYLDASLDAMKYAIIDLVNTVIDIEKTHGLSPGQTFEKIESRIIEIETAITLLAAEIKKVTDAEVEAGEIKVIAEKISEISRQMEDAVYAVKYNITGMETSLREDSSAIYAKEIGGMRREVASVREAMAELMRLLLILSE